MKVEAEAVIEVPKFLLQVNLMPIPDEVIQSRTIEYRRGKMRVKISPKLMFAPKPSEGSPKGMRAMRRQMREPGT